MKLSRYFTVVFHICIFHGGVAALNEQNNVSQLEAVKECSRRGGSLVNYKEIQDKFSVQKYLDQLENGATAWIDGYAEYSPILHWRGCYSIIDMSNIYTFKMDDRSLFSCSKECLRHDASVSYVGVKDTTCYCIPFKYFNDLLPDIDMVNPSLCNISCSNNGVGSCGGDFHIDIYKKGPEFHSFDMYGTGAVIYSAVQRQCVYFRGYTPNLEVYTASCHRLFIDGFVCEEVESSTLATDTCTNTSTYRNTKYCFKVEPSTWQDAFNHCLEINGRLSFDGVVTVTKTAGFINYTFWSGVFRSFGLSDNHTSNSVCIAATKINNIIYFEPDDCSVEKHFLCKFNKTTVSTSSVKDQQARQSPGITKFRQDLSFKTGSTIGYISLAISVVALVIAVIVIILLYKFKKLVTGAVLPNINSGQRADSVNQNPIQCNDENYSLVNSSRHYAVPDCVSCPRNNSGQRADGVNRNPTLLNDENCRHYAVPDCENRSSDTHRKHSTEKSGFQPLLAETSFVEEGLQTAELHHVYEGLSDNRQHAVYEVISRANDSKQ